MVYVFGGTIMLVESESDSATHGWFIIKYEYLPADLYIKIDSEYGLFTVRIEQKDGTFTFLNRVEKFDNRLSFNNLDNAIGLLKKAINRPLTFYKATADGLFRKEGIRFIRVSREEIRNICQTNGTGDG